MPLWDAEGLRKREALDQFPLKIGDAEIIVKRPDLPLLIMRGLAPQNLFGSVLNLVAEWAGKDVQDLPPDVISENEKVLNFVNHYVCAALVVPRGYMTRAEADEHGGLCVPEDLLITTRRFVLTEIMNRVNQAMQHAQRQEVAAATEFPEGGPGAGTGQDVQAVRPATV